MTSERWFVRLWRRRQRLLFGESTTRRAHVVGRTGAGVVVAACGGMWRRARVRVVEEPEQLVLCEKCVRRRKPQEASA